MVHIEIVYQNADFNNVGIQLNYKEPSLDGDKDQRAIARMEGGLLTFTGFILTKLRHPKSCPGYQHIIGEAAEDYILLQLKLNGYTDDIKITSSTITQEEYWNLYKPLKPIKFSVVKCKSTMFQIADSISYILGFGRYDPLGNGVASDGSSSFTLPSPFTVVKPRAVEPVTVARPAEPPRAERVLVNILDNIDRYHFPISILAITGGILLLGREAYEAGVAVTSSRSFDSLLRASLVSGFANSLVANRAEHIVYKRKNMETMKQFMFDFVKYSIMWGMIISSSDILKGVWDISSTKLESNNLIIKFIQATNNWSDRARLIAFGTTLAIQNATAIFSRKLKEPEIGKKFLVEQLESLTEAWAVAVYPPVIMLNFISMLLAGYERAKDYADSKFPKKKK